MTGEIDIEEQKIWALLEEVSDPEVPVLSVLDLGIIRAVKITEPLQKSPFPQDAVQGDLGAVEVTITPTYTGCPAMDMISMNIKLALIEHGYKKIKIISVLSPPWTTDWMTEAGKQKLREYGIAPPKGSVHNQWADPSESNEKIECPQCNSTNTKLISQFGSTACKALYQCNDCKEPFDYFKCH